MGFGIDVSMLSLVQSLTLSEPIHSLTSRFFLNLRSIAFHKPESTLGDPTAHSAVPGFPGFHPRRSSKQSGVRRPKLIVEIGMDTTVYRSGRHLNEGDSQQPPEAYDLDLLDSQNHGYGLERKDYVR